MVGTDANSDTQKYFSHDPIYRQVLQALATVHDLNPGWMERMRESRLQWYARRACWCRKASD